ncbi:MAG: hypothetical protein WAK44_30730, partial [Trebonia sp.]|uniref:hypothetical protein n=1 Tax=Trebonia sp. TaxID=2767075 RepID=UPI003BB1DE18
PVWSLPRRPETTVLAHRALPAQGPSRLARLPALLRAGSPAQSIPVRSPTLLADASVVQPGGTAGHLARAAGEVIASLVS